MLGEPVDIVDVCTDMVVRYHTTQVRIIYYDDTTGSEDEPV
jgi:hypothetical protein